MHALTSPLSFSAVPNALPLRKASMMMRRLITILTAATLVQGVLAAAAEANGSRRLGSQIRFGSIPGPYGSGLRQHIRHGNGAHSCYFPDEWPKLPPWPPFCN